MDNFAKAVEWVLEDEGGEKFTNNPKDPGGATKYGISLRFAGSVKLDLDGDGQTTKADIVALTKAEAMQLYLVHFWMVLQCKELPRGLDYCVFDCGVNQGVAAAGRLLQRSIGAKEDGKIGPATIAAVHVKSNDLIGLTTEFMAQRNTRYCRLAIESVNAQSFILGWMRRTARVEAHAIRMING